jgi:endonuclease-3
MTNKTTAIVLKLLKKKYGQTSTALKFENTFQLLVSTMLAAQSTDKQVNKITKSLYQKHSDVSSFSKLSIFALEKEIKSVGLYKNKAKNIIATANMILDKFAGKVPRTREELIQLPGVGRKTANVVLSVGFKQNAIAVDTHVFRVSNRIGLANAKNVEQTELQLMKEIPSNDWSAAHHWLIWHGRTLCKAQGPQCENCFLQNHCLYFKNNSKAKSI